jgi:Protein of unknown function (DUF1573)
MKKYLLILPILLTACLPQAVQGNVTPIDGLDYDFGEISIDGGEVEKGFHFRNDGEEDLVLKGAETSCGCTEAYFELPDGTISPIFGMHENPEWEYVIKPGEVFEIEVEFDPMSHGPDAVGPVIRDVTIFTDTGDIEVRISADVLYNQDYLEKYSDSPFVFEEVEYDYGMLKQSAGITSKEFEFTYLGDDPITITGTPGSCACTSAEISKDSFTKGEKGILTVHFDPNVHAEPEGKFFKSVSILTEPALEKQPEVKVWAEIDLDLGPEAFKLQEVHKD